MFDVPLPAGEALPFLIQPADAASKQQHRAGGRDT